MIDTLISRFKTAIKELKPTYAGGYILKGQAVETLESLIGDAAIRKDAGVGVPGTEAKTSATSPAKLQLLQRKIEMRADSRYDNQFLELLEILIGDAA